MPTGWLLGGIPVTHGLIGASPELSDVSPDYKVDGEWYGYLRNMYAD